MSITYNVLNLQQTLSQGGTAVATYSWLADGTKCAVVDNTTNGFDYLGSLKYTRNGSTRTLESTDFGGGRVVYSGGVYNRYYYITDHLGSVRVITDNSGAVQERNDYYPFGGRHANSNYGQLSANKQKFNGKELQTSGFLDYGARMYDDAIGRWSVVDPSAEKYKGLSPYNYCENNSISLIDPDGKSSTEAVEQDQKKNNEGPNWFQQAFATTLLSIINTAKLYGDNKTGNQTETEKLAAGFNLFTSVVFAIQGGFEMMKPSNSMSKSGNLAGYTDDAVSVGEVKGVTNPVPTRLARVIPANINSKTLGKSNMADIFVTAADDIAGLNASQIAEKLTIPMSNSGFKVIEFNTPKIGLSSPINRTNPGFVGFGRTAGGAREFSIPNSPIPNGSIIKKVK